VQSLQPSHGDFTEIEISLIEFDIAIASPPLSILTVLLQVITKGLNLPPTPPSTVCGRSLLIRLQHSSVSNLKTPPLLRGYCPSFLRSSRSRLSFLILLKNERNSCFLSASLSAIACSFFAFSRLALAFSIFLALGGGLIGSRPVDENGILLG
jgi:hypothetical protein